jgi:hypothetical protein
MAEFGEPKEFTSPATEISTHVQLPSRPEPARQNKLSVRPAAFVAQTGKPKALKYGKKSVK